MANQIMENQNRQWQVHYPKGMIKYIDFFREEYFQYEIFDRVVNDYILKHSKIPVKNICSLGAGTGRHERQFDELGYNVIGLERSLESIDLANEKVNCENNVCLLECDFLKEDDVKRALEGKKFDCILMLFIPVSLDDHIKAAKIMSPYLNEGGLFVTDNFGYKDNIIPNTTIHDSDFANDPMDLETPLRDRDFCVRLNYYKYTENEIDWAAVYLYKDENGYLKIDNDHDILEVISEEKATTKFKLDDKYNLELLPFKRVTECTDDLTPPHVYEYITAWRKK